jgi:hypothetical protein
VALTDRRDDSVLPGAMAPDEAGSGFA